MAKRLLLLKFGAIGDVVMAIPAAMAMVAEGYAVDWVAGEAVAPLLRLYPGIHVIAVNEGRLVRGSVPQRVRAIVALWRALRARVAAAGAYEVCATLYYDRRYRVLSLPVRAPRRVALRWTDRALQLLPGRHHTDEYARILLGRPDGETPGRLAPVPVQGLPACALVRELGRPRVVLVPAGARNLLRDDGLRRWPVERYVALAGALVRRGCEVVLAGGPEDRWASPYFAGLIGAGGVVDAIGTMSLVETVGLLHSAEVTVTHDTGPLHLAGLTATGIVAVFGPTDPRGRLPRRANCVALWGGEDFACRPCYDGREYAPCAHNGCMAEVTAERVMREVEGLLAAKAAGRELPPQVIAVDAGNEDGRETAGDLVQVVNTGVGGR